MSRIFLIARREYAAYARTAGFWLSLLALPLFGLLGGGLPILMRSAEPVRAVAVVEQGPEASGLAAALSEALDRDAARRAERMQAAEKAVAAVPGAQGRTPPLASMNRPKLRLVAAPAELTQAAPEARAEAARRLLDHDDRAGEGLDAVVLLERVDGKPSAQVWTARATDDTVAPFVREALKTRNRQEVLAAAGIDPAVVEGTERFAPEVRSLSPRSASGGEVSLRDRLPAIVGFAGGMILWSLIITGASILLNSVMEEKANKILEVLLSSASATEILAGKVLGVALLTLTVLAVWGSVGAAIMMAAAPSVGVQLADVLASGPLIAGFLVFMVGGYLMYAVLFAAIGAFCETPRDAQTLMGPIMMVLVVPIMAMSMALQTPDAAPVRMLSWVPFFTPFLMMARLPAEPPMLDVVGSMAGMAVTALLMVWIAGRAFRAGALADVKLSWKTFAAAIRSAGR